MCSLITSTLLCASFTWGIGVDSYYIMHDSEARAHLEASPFNQVTIENSLKWKYWSIPTVQSDALGAIEWATSHGLSIKGHAVHWFKPGEFKENITEEEAQARAKQALKIGKIEVWDLLNEPSVFAPSVDSRVLFEQARAIDPTKALLINDFAINNEEVRRRYHLFIRHVLGELDGIGLQGHILEPMTAEQLEVVIEEFEAYNKPIFITEYDCPWCSSEAQHLWQIEQILRAVDNHELVRGFTVWGLSDKTHWFHNSPIYDSNWVLKSSGQYLFGWIESKKPKKLYFPMIKGEGS